MKVKYIKILILFFICSARLLNGVEYNATVSDERLFVWFRVAKVATRSITEILVERQVPVRPETKLLFKPKQFKYYFKFAFVRNPWDRLVSCYFNKVLTKNHRAFRECYGKDFDYFVDFVSKKDLESADRHIQFQTSLIPLGFVDFIGRMENFEADLRIVLEKIGIDPLIEIPKKNQTSRLHYSYYYTEKTKKIVEEIYKRDINYFGYSFEVAPPIET